MCKKDELIIMELLDMSRGKLSSRYILALERALESIHDGNTLKAKRAQNKWED